MILKYYQEGADAGAEGELLVSHSPVVVDWWCGSWMERVNSEVEKLDSPWP